jgi:hypothetical protein
LSPGDVKDKNQRESRIQLTNRVSKSRWYSFSDSLLEQETRAIMVQAPAEQVWPWVAQLGQDRGGFYSYRLLENLVGCDMPNLHHLDPALQQLRSGQ